MSSERYPLKAIRFVDGDSSLRIFPQELILQLQTYCHRAKSSDLKWAPWFSKTNGKVARERNGHPVRFVDREANRDLVVASFCYGPYLKSTARQLMVVRDKVSQPEREFNGGKAAIILYWTVGGKRFKTGFQPFDWTIWQPTGSYIHGVVQKIFYMGFKPPPSGGYHRGRWPRPEQTENLSVRSPSRTHQMPASTLDEASASEPLALVGQLEVRPKDGEAAYKDSDAADSSVLEIPAADETPMYEDIVSPKLAHEQNHLLSFSDSMLSPPSHQSMYHVALPTAAPDLLHPPVPTSDHLNLTSILPQQDYSDSHPDVSNALMTERNSNDGIRLSPTASHIAHLGNLPLSARVMSSGELGRVTFIFKKSHDDHNPRQRTLAQYSNAKQLSGHARAAGIPCRDTSTLQININQEAPKIVVCDDEQDFQDILQNLRGHIPFADLSVIVMAEDNDNCVVMN